MPKARGRVKEILIIVGRIQDLVGQARGNHWNDRSQTAFETAQKQLEEALDLCIKVRSKYDPID